MDGWDWVALAGISIFGIIVGLVVYWIGTRGDPHR